MAAVPELEGFSAHQGKALTVGVFDGVHKGHRELIRLLNIQAAQGGLTSGVITFLNHPRTVLVPGAQHSYLITPQERIVLLRRAGADEVFPITFTSALSRLTYREFAEVLVRKLSMRRLLIGEDFAMGKERQGTGPALTALGEELGYSVAIAQPLLVNGEVASTTAVRHYVETGNVASAELLLGRPYTLTGTVVSGERRGRDLGFPTANLQVPAAIQLPLDGIYATVALVDGAARPSVTSIGVRPTFGGGQRTIETYIMDFDGNLYGKTMAIQLVHRIREELNFANPDSLVAQIRTDVLSARQALATRAKG